MIVLLNTQGNVAHRWQTVTEASLHSLVEQEVCKSSLHTCLHEYELRKDQL